MILHGLQYKFEATDYSHAANETTKGQRKALKFITEKTDDLFTSAPSLTPVSRTKTADTRITSQR